MAVGLDLSVTHSHDQLLCAREHVAPLRLCVLSFASTFAVHGAALSVASAVAPSAGACAASPLRPVAPFWHTRLSIDNVIDDTLDALYANQALVCCFCGFWFCGYGIW